MPAIIVLFEWVSSELSQNREQSYAQEEQSYAQECDVSSRVRLTPVGLTGPERGITDRRTDRIGCASGFRAYPLRQRLCENSANYTHGQFSTGVVFRQGDCHTP